MRFYLFPPFQYISVFGTVCMKEMSIVDVRRVKFGFRVSNTNGIVWCYVLVGRTVSL